MDWAWNIPSCVSHLFLLSHDGDARAHASLSSLCLAAASCPAISLDPRTTVRGSVCLPTLYSLKQRSGNVACTSSDDKVESHLGARERQSLGEHNVSDRNHGGESEGDEGQGAVPAVLAVVRGQDNLGVSLQGVERPVWYSRRLR